MKKSVGFRLGLTLIIIALAAGSALAWQPNDALYYRQWGFHAIGMESAWDFNQGGSPEIKVAVLDSGVDYNIPDFANTNFDMANAWDYVSGDSEPYDEVGHGTHVAATIAQSTNNRVGAAGIAFNTTILPIRVLDENGNGSLEHITAGIYRAVNAGADVINLSLSYGSGLDDFNVFAACEYARDNGVFISAAAGNNRPPNYASDFPAWYSSTVAVGAVQPDLNVWERSQHAWDYTGPAITAPGVGICQEIADPALVDPAFQYFTGTSMSTAMVSGVAALALAEAQDLGLYMPENGAEKVDLLKYLLLGTAQDIGPSGIDYESGWGMVRADWALGYLNSLANSGQALAIPAYASGAY
jgi:serine protease